VRVYWLQHLFSEESDESARLLGMKIDACLEIQRGMLSFSIHRALCSECNFDINPSNEKSIEEEPTQESTIEESTAEASPESSDESTEGNALVICLCVNDYDGQSSRSMSRCTPV